MKYFQGTGRIFIYWTAAVCAGTALASAAFAYAFGPMVRSALAWETVPPLSVLLLAAAVAGAFHGLAVGVGEQIVLHKRIARIDYGWTAATTLSAALAWTGCLLVNLEGANQGVSPDGWIARVVAGGLVFGGLIGFAQWIVLRRVLTHSGTWIAANALAWLAGSAVVIFGIKLADSAGAPLAVTALLIVTVLLSSAAAGTITGLTLLRLLRQSAAPIPTRVGA